MYQYSMQLYISFLILFTNAFQSARSNVYELTNVIPHEIWLNVSTNV